MADSSVKVAVRIRPLVNRELARGDKTVTTVNEIEQQLTIGGKASFTFDHVFDCSTPQSNVYDNCVSNLVEGIFDGYNATVLAYGQTGSGKTHTMGTGMDLTGHIPPQDLGIVPRAVQHIFDGIDARKREAQENGILPPVFEVNVTFVELYNENIFDLLNNNKERAKITMYEDPSTNEIQLAGVQSVNVKSPEDLMEALRSGALNRTVGATNMNEQSSRSHAIFSIYLKQQRSCQSADAASAANTTVDFEFLTAKFHFVDLAGSERIAKTGATGARAKEGCNINMGLLMLGNVIKALAEKEQVNYRMSKLTRLLKDSLGGNSRTLMIACASPSECDFVETYNTMQYANRTKNIKNKVVANQDKSSRLISDLRHKIAELEGELLEFRSGKKVVNTDGTVTSTDTDIENSALLAEVNKLNTKVKALNDALDQSKKRNVFLQQQNIQDIARQYGGTGEADEDSIASMATKYVEEVENLRNELSIAHCTIDDLRKQLVRLKAALTSRGNFPVDQISPSSVNIHEISDHAENSELLKHLKDDIDLKKKRHDEVEGTLLKRVLPNKSANGSVASLNLNGEEGRISVEDEEMDVEIETGDDETEDEAEQIASEEKERLCEELTQLQDDINVKLQLVSTIERSEQRIIAIKAEYEKKMANLLERIQQTEKERNQMLEKMAASNTGKNYSKAVEKKIQEVKEQYEEKLGGLKKEFKKFKDMEKNHQRMVEQQKRQQSDLEKYRREVEAMKKSKVDLVKKINQESKIIQDRERAQQKKMAAMVKDVRKRDLKIQQLESKEKQREEFLKRQTEEYNRKRQHIGMDAKLNSLRKATTPLTPKSSKLRNARSKINWESVEKSIFKQISQRQMYEQVREQLESKVAERQQLEKIIEDLGKNFVQLKNNFAERQAVTEQLKSYKEKTDYLDNEINELRQEIIGGDEEDTNAFVGADVEKAVDNCKNLEDAKFLCKRLIQLSIEQGSNALKAEQSAKMLNSELEYMKNNYVEADEIVNSFMDTVEECDAVDNVAVKQDKARRKTATPSDFLFPGTSLNTTQIVNYPGPGGDADGLLNNILNKPNYNYNEKSQKQKSRDVLKEMNGDNTLTENDDETESTSEATDSYPYERTQQFVRYTCDKVAIFADVFVGHSNTVYSLSASEECLVSGSRDRKAFVWDISTGKKSLELKGHPTHVTAVKIVPQSSLIVTGSGFHMRLWDSRTGNCEVLFQSSGLVAEGYEHSGRRGYVPPSEDSIRTFDVDPTGQYLYSNLKGSIRCWDLRQQTNFGKITLDDNFLINSISVQSAEDGSGHVQLFCGHMGQKDTVYEGKGKVSVHQIPHGQVSNNSSKGQVFLDNPVTDVIPDGKVFFCSTDQGSILRYNLMDMKREAIISRSSPSPLNKLCFIQSPNGINSLLAGGYDDGVVKFYDYKGRQGLKEEGRLCSEMDIVSSVTTNSKKLFYSLGRNICVYDVTYNPL